MGPSHSGGDSNRRRTFCIVPVSRRPGRRWGKAAHSCGVRRPATDGAPAPRARTPAGSVRPGAGRGGLPMRRHEVVPHRPAAPPVGPGAPRSPPDLHGPAVSIAGAQPDTEPALPPRRGTRLSVCAAPPAGWVPVDRVRTSDRATAVRSPGVDRAASRDGVRLPSGRGERAGARSGAGAVRSAAGRYRLGARARSPRAAARAGELPAPGPTGCAASAAGRPATTYGQESPSRPVAGSRYAASARRSAPWAGTRAGRGLRQRC